MNEHTLAAEPKAALCARRETKIAAGKSFRRTTAKISPQFCGYCDCYKLPDSPILVISVFGEGHGARMLP